MNLKLAAARGAQLLDKKIPDWYHKVKLTKLNMFFGEMENGCGCVGAQLDGRYELFMQHIGCRYLSGRSPLLPPSTDSMATSEQIGVLSLRRGKTKSASGGTAANEVANPTRRVPSHYLAGSRYLVGRASQKTRRQCLGARRMKITGLHLDTCIYCQKRLRVPHLRDWWFCNVGCKLLWIAKQWRMTKAINQ